MSGEQVPGNGDSGDQSELMELGRVALHCFNCHKKGEFTLSLEYASRMERERVCVSVKIRE